jgi:hypothetical protein
MKVEFKFKSGRVVTTNEAQARVLKRLRKGDYLTRDMADQPTENKDGLDELSREELHALAKERGVHVHHASGADKVREALRNVITAVSQ